MRIWKWTLAVTDTQLVQIPLCATLLTVQMQKGEPQLWALVDENAPVCARTIATYGTGNPLPGGDLGKYIGTYQVYGGDLVFHVFDMGTP